MTTYLGDGGSLGREAALPRVGGDRWHCVLRGTEWGVEEVRTAAGVGCIGGDGGGVGLFFLLLFGSYAL